MIEQLIKKKKSTFVTGEVSAIDTTRRRVLVVSGNASTWIDTSLSLAAGDTVICARDESKQKFIIQAASNVRPSVNTLLLV
jgi:NADH dehydrogenase FAD-containing subunit